MELERYHELRTLLQQWKARLAENIRRQIEDTGHWLTRLRTIYDNEGTDEEFTLWLDRWCRQAAIQFILHILFLRVLEDRGLLGAERIRSTDGQKMWSRLTRNLGAAGYVQWCCRDAAHLLPDLFEPTEYDLVLPEDELAQRFLDEVWRRPDPNRPGWLRFDFRSDPERGDQGFQTRFIGDLYQELDAEIRQRYALLQTPHFISQFILEHTLLKRFEEKDFREVTLMDPTIGSGHFAVDGFWMFVDQYEKAVGKRRHQLTVAERMTIAQDIIERHLFGCDINPYASALARFRLMLAACDYARPALPSDLRDLRFNIVTIDSLIPYEKLMLSGLKANSELARTIGQPAAIKRSLPLLQRRYDVVIGNPPYIQAQDAAKRELYRTYHESAYRTFGLSAPFTERFFQMASVGGHVGLITSNAFASRQFGKKLIENVLPKFDLQTIIDLSGAYIPGHGTPTLIILARNQKPTNQSVWVLSNLKGEPGTPPHPEEGSVWQGVLRAVGSGLTYADEYVDFAERPRDLLSKHPWQFGGRATRLYERLLLSCPSALKRLAKDMGYSLQTNADQVFCVPEDYARRLRIPHRYLRQFALGEPMRDWTIQKIDYIVFPYDSRFDLIDLDSVPALQRYLTRYKQVLGNRKVFSGETYFQAGRHWQGYHQFSTAKHSTNELLSHAFIATHNHFIVDSSRRLFNRSAPVIQLPDEESAHTRYRILAGIMNSSTSCFCLKQVCYNKGTGDDPVRDRFEYASTNIAQIPIPSDLSLPAPNDQRMLSLVDELTTLADHLRRQAMRTLFISEGEGYHTWNRLLDGYLTPHEDFLPPFVSSRELQEARDWGIELRNDTLGRMVFLQEEADWLAYEMYGLIRRAPLASDYLTLEQQQRARLQLGQRPFEVAGRGYRGDWPINYSPDPLPDYLKSLTDARIAIIETNKDIALLEDPLYKRRWVPPDHEKEFQDAAEWWLAEKLEFAIEQYGRPISLRRWARLLANDERVNATLEVLTGSPMFDFEQELLKVIQANAVPNRPEHYLKIEGLRKLHIQGAEFESKEFNDSTAWKIRGKLNIPRERFIAYTEFDATQRGADAPENGGPWFGWAGWDAAQRAEALVYLLEQAGRAGWELHFRQCGLRAALRTLLQEGDLDHLPEADRLEFEGIAGMCGIGLETSCYCQAYRDGISRGEPGVPGVSEEVLQVKVLDTGSTSSDGRRKTGKDKPNQLRLDL